MCTHNVMYMYIYIHTCIYTYLDAERGHDKIDVLYMYTTKEKGEGALHTIYRHCTAGYISGSGGGGAFHLWLSFTPLGRS